MNLPKFPERIARLPVDSRGYPVPWFVEWIDGKPQFPIISEGKRVRAIQKRLCWICGENLGAYLSFVIGPMCMLNRTSAEPPSHLECASFAVLACPFLINPKAKRIENEHTKNGVDVGVAIKRNPGVSVIWNTKKYSLFNAGQSGWLIDIGEPQHVSCWKEGRSATINELRLSIESGLPELYKLASEDGSEDELERAVRRLEELIVRRSIFNPGL